jgi:transposase
MPKSTCVGIPAEAQAQMLAALRRARYGSLLPLHIMLLCAAGRSPTDIAAVLCCSRSRVYRTVRACRTGTVGLERAAQGWLMPPVRTTVLVPTLRRSLLALLKAPPRAYGGCRTRWSGATLALMLQAKRGTIVSAATMRRRLHELGWVWKRAKLVAKDADPQRIDRLARLRWVFEQLKLGEAMLFADAWAIHLLPKVGCAWMPHGSQLAGMTPGKNQQSSLAGALALATGTLLHCLRPRKPQTLFCDRLSVLATHSPAARYPRLYVVGNTDKIHKAKAVEPWLAAHPRFTWLLLPTACPRANPIARACGDGHDTCPRNHPRQRLPDLVVAGEEHLHVHGPWPSKLSQLSYEPAVTAAVEQIIAADQATAAA